MIISILDNFGKRHIKSGINFLFGVWYMGLITIVVSSVASNILFLILSLFIYIYFGASNKGI